LALQYFRSRHPRSTWIACRVGEETGVVLYENVQPMDAHLGPWEVLAIWKNLLHAPLENLSDL
jgi:hypothetical protein